MAAGDKEASAEIQQGKNSRSIVLQPGSDSAAMASSSSLPFSFLSLSNLAMAAGLVTFKWATALFGLLVKESAELDEDVLSKKRSFSSLRYEQKMVLNFFFFYLHIIVSRKALNRMDWLSACRRVVTRIECLAFQPFQRLSSCFLAVSQHHCGIFPFFFCCFLFPFECALCDLLCFHSSVLRVLLFSKMHPKSPCTCTLMHSKYTPGIK